MNSSQKLLILIAMSFMKVCAGSGLHLDILELGEITPPTTYTVPTNTPILRSNGDDAENVSIFIGVDDTDSTSFRDLMAELSSSRANNGDILAAEVASQRIANRVPTPYFTLDNENLADLGEAADPQANAASGWSWLYQWLSSFIF